jgi:hypothetical protein
MMIPFESIYSGNELPSDYYFYFGDCLIELYSEDGNFAWTYYYSRECREIFNAPPIYATLSEAYRSAKSHAVWSSRKRKKGE